MKTPFVLAALRGLWPGADDFVVYRPKASVLCPAYIIVKDSVLNCFVLAVRGTHTTRDIFTSMSGAAKPHHYVDCHGLVLGYSHLGMLAGARWIFKHCKASLLSAHEKQPDYRVVITGHSMGGGAAAMLTMMIREQLPQLGDVQCYTFACPGCMTLELASSCAPYVTTLIYGTHAIRTGAERLVRCGCCAHDQSWCRRYSERRSGRVIMEEFFQTGYQVITGIFVKMTG